MPLTKRLIEDSPILYCADHIDDPRAVVVIGQGREVEVRVSVCVRQMVRGDLHHKIQEHVRKGEANGTRTYNQLIKRYVHSYSS